MPHSAPPEAFWRTIREIDASVHNKDASRRKVLENPDSELARLLSIDPEQHSLELLEHAPWYQKVRMIPPQRKKEGEENVDSNGKTNATDKTAAMLFRLFNASKNSERPRPAPPSEQYDTPLRWSKYNCLMALPSGNHALYNSLSNSLFRVPDHLLPVLEGWKSGFSGTDESRERPGLVLQARVARVLVHEGEEQDILNIIRFKRQYAMHWPRSLTLTIAPTLACNFNCPYCYERHRRPGSMDNETADRILELIDRHRPGLEKLHVSWYGGEPLLEFDRICSLSERMQALGIPYTASMISNGYELNQTRAGRFNDLKIKSLQVTIDGSPETHNKRRRHIRKGDTYDTILENVDMLLDHWDGRINIRVNIDKSNTDEMQEASERILERLGRHNESDTRVVVYPGFVFMQDRSCDSNCVIGGDERGAHEVQSFRDHNLRPTGFPPSSALLGCSGTRRDAYVIGPQGELYACYSHMSDPRGLIGTIHDEDSMNGTLLAYYKLDSCFWDDPECRQCFLMPVCDGGCRFTRMQRDLYGKDALCCPPVRHKIPELVEVYLRKRAERLAKERKDAEEDVSEADRP